MNNDPRLIELFLPKEISTKNDAMEWGIKTLRSLIRSSDKLDGPLAPLGSTRLVASMGAAKVIGVANTENLYAIIEKYNKVHPNQKIKPINPAKYNMIYLLDDIHALKAWRKTCGKDVPEGKEDVPEGNE